jgi:hypothetical protein
MRAVTNALGIYIEDRSGPSTWTVTSYVGDRGAAIWIRQGVSTQTHRFSLAWGVAQILQGPDGQQVVGSKFAGPGLSYALDLVMPPQSFHEIGRSAFFDADAMAAQFDVEPDVVRAQAHALGQRGAL